MCVMFETVITVVLFIVLISISGEIMMRVRLTKLETPKEKLLWWRRGGDEVADAYQHTFPNAKFPLVRVYVFWGFIVAVFLLLCVTFLRDRGH